MFRASLCPSSGKNTTCYCSSSNLHSAHTLQRSTTVSQPATSNTTSKYTPYAVTRGLFSWWWALRCPKHVETVVNNQHLQLTINHLYCCILLVFFLHALLCLITKRGIAALKLITYSQIILNWFLRTYMLGIDCHLEICTKNHILRLIWLAAGIMKMRGIITGCEMEIASYVQGSRTPNIYY